MPIHAKRGLLTGAVVLVVLLAVFFVTGTVEWWVFVAVAGGAFVLSRFV